MAEPLKLGSKGRSFAYQSSLMSLYNFLEKVEREAQVRFDEEMKANLLHQFDALYLDSEKKLNALYTSGDLSEKGYNAQTMLLDDTYRRMHAALGHKTTMYGKRQQRAKRTLLDKAKEKIIDKEFKFYCGW